MLTYAQFAPSAPSAGLKYLMGQFQVGPQGWGNTLTPAMAGNAGLVPLGRPAFSPASRSAIAPGSMGIFKKHQNVEVDDYE